MDKIVGCRIDKRSWEHPINSDNLLHISYLVRRSTFFFSLAKKASINVKVDHTGWSKDTGLMVVATVTFHSRKMSIAFAPATKIAINVAYAIRSLWWPADAIRNV